MTLSVRGLSNQIRESAGSLKRTSELTDLCLDQSGKVSLCGNPIVSKGPEGLLGDTWVEAVCGHVAEHRATGVVTTPSRSAQVRRCLQCDT